MWAKQLWSSHFLGTLLKNSREVLLIVLSVYLLCHMEEYSSYDETMRSKHKEKWGEIKECVGTVGKSLIHFHPPFLTHWHAKAILLPFYDIILLNIAMIWLLLVAFQGLFLKFLFYIIIWLIYNILVLDVQQSDSDIYLHFSDSFPI